MLSLLYDLTATQPSPESKFHGGGAYGEVVFFKLLEYTDRISLAAMYDSANYINPAILQAIQDHHLPLFDLQKTTVSDIIREHHVDRAYSAMLNLNQHWDLDAVRVYTTVHGLRTLEMPFDKTMLPYMRSIKEKIKARLFMGPAKRFFLKKMRAINGRLVTDERLQVITISQHSLASIKAFYPQLKDRAIPVFASPLFAQLDTYKPAVSRASAGELEKIGVAKKKYFLITSAARWTKNALRAVQACDDFFADGFAPDYKLVVTGATHPEIFTKGLRHPERCVFLGYVDRPVLELLTQEAYAFIYPSLNEGFGYPPLEAMQYGVPVAASGSSSIPEVCGDAALYFDPYSVTEIKNRLVQLLDATIYAQFAQRGAERYTIVAQKQKDDLQRLAEFLTA